MTLWLAALALQAAAPDEEMLALTECQFALSREESAKRTSVERFRILLDASCRTEAEALFRGAVAFFRARGRSPDEAREESRRLMAQSNAVMVDSYARILALIQ